MQDATNSSHAKQVLKSYILGFLLSLLTTGMAYTFTTRHILTGPLLTYSLLGLAIIQAGVQLVLFLHLGEESKPKWRVLVFLFMASTLLILVAGSIWIMHHLNYNVMPTME